MQTITTRSVSEVEAFNMVEESIKNAEDYPTENELWQSLSKKIKRRSLKHILRHLEFDKKIIYGKGRRIIWIEADEQQSKILREEFTVSR
jgi:hypothetical protein